MKKFIPVIVGILILSFILFGQQILKVTEGFTAKASCTAIIQEPIVKQPLTPEVAEMGIGNIEASSELGSLPSAPADQRSKGVPIPYMDPGKEPAKYIRLLATLYDLQAFFGFQAKSLQDNCDPSIVLPLQRAKADLAEIQNVQMVLERNPGVPSRITTRQLDEIQANLEYLQKFLNDIDASKTGAEGFANIGSRATAKELKDFRTKLAAEAGRLQSSGTSDPIVQTRINTLQRIKTDIDDILDKLSKGLLKADEVPIFQSDLEKALPVLGKPTSPLPQILKQAKLPPAIASAFPNGLSAKDTQTANQIATSVNNYMKDLTQGLSWDLGVAGVANLHYDSPRAQNMSSSYSIKAKGSNPLVDLVNSVADQTSQSSQATTAKPYKRMPEQTHVNTGLPGTSIHSVKTSSTAGNFDWKTRAKQIRDQVRMRGLDPLDFGMISPDTVVSQEFSWRGHVQMVCNRLLTTPDPGLPEVCGCPPLSWSGWKTPNS
jgi:hypothetical protein